MTELIYVQMEVFSLLERYKDLDNVGDVITEQKMWKENSPSFGENLTDGGRLS